MSSVSGISCDTMTPLKLEDITLVNIGIKLWLREEVKQFIKKNSFGLIDTEKAVPLLTGIPSKFQVAAHLKNRLIDIIEKIGYQLYLFLTKPFIDFHFQMETIKWTVHGLIHVTETLRGLMPKSGEKFTLSQFRFACDTFDEHLIREIWSNLARDDNRLPGEVDARYVFSSYWTNILRECDLFRDTFSSFIIGFNRSRSFHANMFWHSVAVNNRAAIRYFRKRLRETDVIRPNVNKDGTGEEDILEFVLATPDDETLPFILSFFEMPIKNEKACQLIVDKMNPVLLERMFHHVLRRVNICGNLHYNIFRHLLFTFRHKWTQQVIDNLQFYALNLLGRGRLETFDFLPDTFHTKKILRRQIVSRLKSKRGLAIFLTIHWNNYTHLLSHFLHWLAENEEDKALFTDFLSAIEDGRQYDP